MLDASVAGTFFTREMLERLGRKGTHAPEALEGLEFRDLIRRRGVARTQGDEEFSFKHGLIRDVAYGTLPHAARRERHAIVAEYLEEVVRFGGTRRRCSPIIGARPGTQSGPSSICSRLLSWRGGDGQKGRRWHSTNKCSS